MKLLHVLTTLDVGGAEMHVLTQIRGQTARGNEVRVAYLKGHGTLKDDFLAAGASRVECVGSGPGALRRLWPHLRWAELVHSHLLKADVLTALAASLAGRRRVLVSGKHNDEQVLTHPLVSRVHGIIGRLPARTIVLSDHVGRFVEQWGRVPRARQERIYYGIDPAPFADAAARPEAEREARRAELGFAPDDIVFVCVARFAPQKAHDVLLRAFARAQRDSALDPDARAAEGAEPTRSGPRLRLLLVGDDPFGDGRERAEALAGELGLGGESGDVVFAGIRRDVPELLGASEVFVMASLWEGLGLVFLEAMAAGLPVLSTRVSAIPEVVVEGETGLLVPPAEVEPLADAMLRLAGDGELRERLGAAGRQRVAERFGLDRMVDETLDVYRDVLARASSPGAHGTHGSSA